MFISTALPRHFQGIYSNTLNSLLRIQRDSRRTRILIGGDNHLDGESCIAHVGQHVTYKADDEDDDDDGDDDDDDDDEHYLFASHPYCKAK